MCLDVVPCVAMGTHQSRSKIVIIYELGQTIFCGRVVHIQRGCGGLWMVGVWNKLGPVLYIVMLTDVGWPINMQQSSNLLFELLLK